MQKKQYSKFIVAFIIFANSLFTAAVLYIFMRTSAEPGILIGAWFAFTTGELWLLADIKKNKIKKEGKINEQQNP